jgi:hypothetical protein
VLVLYPVGNCTVCTSHARVLNFYCIETLELVYETIVSIFFISMMGYKTLIDIGLLSCSKII